MKLPFSIDKYYITDLSKEEVNEELNNLTKEKKYAGLRTDKFIVETSESGFIVGRNTYGIDGFTFEQYPVVEGVYFPGKSTSINIIIKPRYLMIFLFSVFVLLFIPVSIYPYDITINGVFRSLTIKERFLFAFCGVIPGLWCYFGYIKPIKKAENWIVKKLSLTLTDKYGS